MGFTLFDAGRGLQPRPKRLDVSIVFETLNVKYGVANPVPRGMRDAERHRRHSHAERGNDNLSSVGWVER